MAAAVETECTMDSIDWTELPRDSDDGRYIQSFPADDLAAVKEFFQEFGFVVRTYT